MYNKIKYIILSFFAVLGTVAFLYLTGCCSKGGGSGFVVGNAGGNVQEEPKYFEAKVNEDGSINRTIAPSGRFSLYASENTLHKDVVVHIVESPAVGNESNIYYIDDYIYAIKPEREEINIGRFSIDSNAKRDVKMQTNPIILTFSNNERLAGAANYYIGIKEIGENEWQFVNVYSSTSSFIGSNGPTGSFEYKLYKDNVYVALFADFSQNIPDTAKVLSMTASMPQNIIETFDGRYNENIVIKLNFIGDNLSGLKADDYKIRLHYANADSQQVDIKIDGKSANYVSGTSTNQYEAFGELYAHYFEFVPSPASYTAMVLPELVFVLNIKGFPIEDFANDFIVEAFNNSKNAVAFNCTAKLHFDTKEKEADEPEPQPGPDPEPDPGPEPVVQPLNIAFMVASNPTNIIDAENALYFLKPTFSVNASPSIDFSDEEKAAIASAVTVVGADDSILTKTWNNGSLVVSFNRNLSSNTEYTLRMDAVDNLERLIVESFEPLVFKTTNDYYIALSPDADNMFDSVNSHYHCLPTFTLTTNIVLSDEDKAKIASAVRVVGAEEGNIIKRWENDSLIISFNQDLAQNTEYTVSISEIPEIEGKSFTSFQPYVFRTMGNLTLTLTPDNDNIYAAMSPLYHCRPAFTITPNISLGEDDRTKIANAVTLSNAANVVKEWNNEGKLRITLSQNLCSNTDYTLSMNAVNDIKGVNVAVFDNLVFSTIATMAISLTPNAANVFDTLNNHYHCRPVFTISPSFTVNESDKTAIANAVSVSGVNENIINKQWNGNSLTLGFTQNIATSSDYTISIAPVDNITGIEVAGFDSLDFTTIPDLIVSIATASHSIVTKAASITHLIVNDENYYYCKPCFVVSSNINLNDDLKTRIANALTASGMASGLLAKSWNGNDLDLSFSDSLAASTSYTISISDITDIEGVTVRTFAPYEFVTFFHQGSGTEEDPFTIYTPVQLACLDYYSAQPYYYKQMENLNLSGYANWKPIGGTGAALSFKGKYNGNHKTISNAIMNYPSSDSVGIFSGFNNCIFSDLTIENITLTGRDEVGALVGYGSKGTFTNIIANNISVNGNESVGGVFGKIFTSYVLNSEFSNIEVNAAGTDCGIVIGFANNMYSISDCSVSDSSAAGLGLVGGFVGETAGSGEFTNILCDNVTVSGNGTSPVFDGLGGFSGQSCDSVKDNCRVINSRILGENTNLNCGGLVGVIGNYINYIDITRNCVVSNTEVTSKKSAGGLFGDYTVSDDSSNLISNCSVENSTISGVGYTGGLVGNNEYGYGNGIQNSTVTNTLIVSTDSCVGGLAGRFNSGLDSNSVENTTIQNQNGYVGGLVGISEEGTINNCHVASISISSTGMSIAGLIGNSKVDITSCYSDNVRITGGQGSSGGLVGDSRGNISNCYVNDLIIQSQSSSVGGLVGYSKKAITECHVASAALKCRANIGGLVGDSYDKITNCYADNVKITGSNMDVGGLVGHIGDNSEIDYCYVTMADIRADNNNDSYRQCYGGLVGESYGVIQRSYVASCSVDANRFVGGIVGCASGGSIAKCFVKNSNLSVPGGAVGNSAGGICGSMEGAIPIDSCYVKQCDITCKLTFGGLVSGCKSTVANCYIFDTTVTASSGYGALADKSTENGLFSDCFISDDHTPLLKTNNNSNPLTNCYNTVSSSVIFNSKTWSNGAWSNFDTAVFPPQLTEVEEPQ